MNDRKGKIAACPKNGCAFHCCTFNQENFIVLFPNELNDALSRNESMKHLEIIDTLSNNSHKVICRASDRSICDGGYKPVDCKLYPLFPTQNKDYFLKGQKCPLSKPDLKKHIEACEHLLSEIKFCSIETLDSWYSTFQLVGYEKYSTD